MTRSSTLGLILGAIASAILAGASPATAVDPFEIGKEDLP